MDSTNGDYTQKECESAGCCFDSYHNICYDSSPATRETYPITAECVAVEAQDRESCGFGLSSTDCAAMTGCCWDVTDESNHFCYKSILQTLDLESTNATNVNLESKPEPRSMTIEIADVTNSQQAAADVEPIPEINLKIANRGNERNEMIEYREESISQKLQLWLNFISQLTQKIEDACDSKVQEKCLCCLFSVCLVYNSYICKHI